MSRAVTAIFAFAYDELGLHRLQAVTMPDNAASVKLLESRGFIREGFARKYLKINGQWQDHVIFAMLADDWRAHGEPRS